MCVCGVIASTSKYGKLDSHYMMMIANNTAATTTATSSVTIMMLDGSMVVGHYSDNIILKTQTYANRNHRLVGMISCLRLTHLCIEIVAQNQTHKTLVIQSKASKQALKY